jgi:hypothetical protein
MFSPFDFSVRPVAIAQKKKTYLEEMQDFQTNNVGKTLVWGGF